MTTTSKVLVALAALAVPVLAATAVHAANNAAKSGGGSTVNRTVSCHVLYSVEITANAKRPDIGAVANIYSNRSVALIGFDNSHKGFFLDRSACRPAMAKIPLKRAGLPLGGTYAAGDYTVFDGRCLLSGKVLVRMRLHLDGSGTPASAALAVWRHVKTKRGKHLKPLAFIQWSPAHTRAYLAPACA
ncbi:MAG: hypothetical protein ACRET2_07645 [Steroidobacteraceae bacterium]